MSAPIEHLPLERLAREAEAWAKRHADAETCLYVIRLAGALRRSEARRKRALGRRGLR